MAEDTGTAALADMSPDEVEAEIAQLQSRLDALRARREHKEYPKWVKDSGGNDVIAESPEHEQELASAPTPGQGDAETTGTAVPPAPRDPLAGLGR